MWSSCEITVFAVIDFFPVEAGKMHRPILKIRTGKPSQIVISYGDLKKKNGENEPSFHSRIRFVKFMS